MRRRSIPAAVTAGLLLAAGLPATAQAVPPAPDTVQARVWVTTPDRAEQLHERAPVTFGTGTSSDPTIVIDPGTTYQTMDGFGASITDSAANVLYRLSPAAREDAMR